MDRPNTITITSAQAKVFAQDIRAGRESARAIDRPLHDVWRKAMIVQLDHIAGCPKL